MDRIDLVIGRGFSICIPGKIQNIISFLNKKCMFLTAMLIASGLICFWLFFKSIDWFEKI